VPVTIGQACNHNRCTVAGLEAGAVSENCIDGHTGDSRNLSVHSLRAQCTFSGRRLRTAITGPNMQTVRAEISTEICPQHMSPVACLSLGHLLTHYIPKFSTAAIMRHLTLIAQQRYLTATGYCWQRARLLGFSTESIGLIHRYWPRHAP
jgi:hypothetical protein